MGQDLSWYIYQFIRLAIELGAIAIPILIILYIRKRDRQKQVERYNRLYNQDVKDRE